MSGIEWQESREIKPKDYSLYAFCQTIEISVDEIPRTDRIMVFIEKQALAALHDFLAHDTNREHGGVLVGKPFYDIDEKRYFVIIQTAIPAQETQGSSVHLQFTPQSWSFISGIIEENYPDMVIVGWYHSHPGLGVFMSGTDQDTQRAFYNHPWSVAVVADPLAKQTGWFCGGECVRLDGQHVILFDESVSVAVPSIEYIPDVSIEEMEYVDQYSYDKLKWLLPFALFMLFFFVGVWMIIRDRYQI